MDLGYGSIKQKIIPILQKKKKVSKENELSNEQQRRPRPRPSNHRPRTQRHHHVILWKQSPRLLVVVILSIFAEKRVTKWLYRIETKCTKLAGFDKLEWDGWNKNHDLSEALRKFEDMRINAKEIEIEQSVRKAQDKEEMEKACNDFFRSFFQPLNSLASIIPTIIAAYVGGRLVQQNQVSSADFGTFTYGAAQLLSKFNQLKRTTVCLYKMTDERFKTGFDIMDLLIKKPKIGID